MPSLGPVPLPAPLPLSAGAAIALASLAFLAFAFARLDWEVSPSTAGAAPRPHVLDEGLDAAGTIDVVTFPCQVPVHRVHQEIVTLIRMTGNLSVVMGEVLLKDGRLIELLQQDASKFVSREGCVHL